MAQLLQSGQHLGGYGIESLIGKGGMGEVYRARQLSMDRQVALKVLSPRLARQDPKFAQQFRDEARAAGRLSHPNIIAVHDVGTAPHPVDGETIHYFSMELVDGESVKEVLQREGTCPRDLVTSIMLAMSEALVYAEAQHIIHRDIKPDNIMLTSKQVAKLADLGLAMRVGDEAGADKDEQGRSKVMGTPLYMSPEQARATALDARSDQYSLGATLYHMLTGHAPFTAPSAKEIMKAHVFAPVPDPQEENPGISQPWRDLCMRLMAKSPEDRFPTATALRDAVRQIAYGDQRSGATARQRTPRPLRSRSGSPWAGPLILAGVLVAGAIVLFVVMDRAKPEQPDALTLVPVPDTAEVTRQAAATAIAALPADNAQAVGALERLLGEARFSTGPARALLEAELSRRRAPRPDPAANDAKLAQAELLASDPGRLAELRKLLPALGGLDLAPPQRTRLDALRAKVDEQIRRANERWKANVATAATPAACDELQRELAAAPEWIQRDEVTRMLAARRLALAPKPPPPVDPGPAWRAFAAEIDPLRGTPALIDLGTRLESLGDRLPPGPDRELGQVLVSDLSMLIGTAEKRLQNHIQKETPTVLVRFGAKDLRKVRLVRLSTKELATAAPDQPNVAATAQPRTSLDLDWRSLLDRALNTGVDKDAGTLAAAWLWFWRLPEADTALAALGEDPFGRALRAYERHARLFPQVANPPLRADDRVEFSYRFDPWDHALVGDFQGEGLTLGANGLFWQTGASRPDRDAGEDRLPGVRWKGLLAAPATAELQCRVEADSVLAIGLAVDGRAVRTVLNLRQGTTAIIATAATGRTFAIVPITGGGPMLGRDRLLTLGFVLGEDGRVELSLDGRPLATAAPLQLPAGRPATLVMQTLQTPGTAERPSRSACAIQNLVLKGRLPGSAQP